MHIAALELVLKVQLVGAKKDSAHVAQQNSHKFVKLKLDLGQLWRYRSCFTVLCAIATLLALRNALCQRYQVLLEQQLEAQIRLSITILCLSNLD